MTVLYSLGGGHIDIKDQYFGDRLALMMRWAKATSAMSENDAEVICTELEFALLRGFEAFGRWQTKCWPLSLTSAQAVLKTPCCILCE